LKRLPRLLLLLLALGVVPSAAAATLTLTVLTSSPVTAPAVTLSGDDQTKTFTMFYSVAYTGAGNTLGWNVTAASTTLTSPTPVKTLDAMTITGVTSSACSGGGCNNPANTITYTTPITLTTSPQKIFNATAGTGKGTVLLTATYSLVYWAKALPATYSATVTVAAATGP
jgi:hypothetical protein